MAQQRNPLVELTTHDSVVIARVLPREIMDVGQTNELFKQIRRGLEGRTPPQLIISMAGVRHVCSSVIANLCATFRQVVTKQEGRLVICNVGPELSETLRLMRLDMLLPIYDSEEESLASFRP